MRDLDVRTALRDQVLAKYYADGDSRVVEELGLCQGEARVDVAVVNGALHGFEIKSEADTLSRLERQIVAYGRVFDRVTIVLGESHLSAAVDIVPRWWGVSVARMTARGVRISSRRAGRANPGVSAFHLAQLLWRDEALALLARKNRDRGLRSKPRSQIWEVVSQCFSLAELRRAVRDVLKSRTDWRDLARQR